MATKIMGSPPPKSRATLAGTWIFGPERRLAEDAIGIEGVTGMSGVKITVGSRTVEVDALQLIAAVFAVCKPKLTFSPR